MKYTIKSRYTDSVLYEGEGESLRDVVVAATKSRANLSGADLSGAYLSGANLSRANLSRADLSCADLSRADLSRADLSGANLSCANLSGADLYGANLSGANLYGANLYGAKLKDAVIADGGNVIVQIGSIGSRAATLTVFRTDKGLRLQTGCFYGDADTFLMNVADTHGTTQHATNYRNALELAASMLVPA
jgi:hypothetical protein